MYVLTEEGKKYLKEGLPEINLVKLLENGPIEISKIKTENFSVALQWGKRNKWLDVREGKLFLISEPSSYELEDSLERLNRSEIIDENLLKILIQRKLAVEERETIEKKAEKLVGKEIGNLNPELISTGLWKDVKLKHYNVEASGKKINVGKKSPYASFLDWARNKMVSLGFEESKGELVQTEFWNMDALYMPQFHSARDIHDAYFLKKPCYAKEIDKNVLNAVKNAHEHGIKESKGWEYQYDLKRAHRLVMITQDTSITPKTLTSKSLKVPGKYFQISRCFRYDVIDATHLADFYQLGGFVIEEGINFRHLAGLLRMFAREFANSDKIKLVPGYFPFTEPSVELHVKHDKLGWIELGGAGMFRPEMLEPLGIKKPVIAWGLGIDRIGMFNMGMKDIRDLFSYDLNYLRNSKVVY